MSSMTSLSEEEKRDMPYILYTYLQTNFAICETDNCSMPSNTPLSVETNRRRVADPAPILIPVLH
jgi:hypothetical protein